MSRPPFESFLADYSEPVREIALAARDLLSKTLPKAVESVDKPAKVIGYAYGSGYKGLVCTLIMSKSGVKLGIVRGAELPDPSRLMKGEGKVHRHVPLRSVADLKRPELRQLLRSALAAWQTRNSANG